MSSCAAYSGNPDKEAMMTARRALRDEAMAELKSANAEDPSDPRIRELNARCSNLQHACASYLVFVSWMKDGVGGSLTYNVYPETKEQAEVVVANLERQRKDDLRDGNWAWLHEGYEYKHYGCIPNRAEWWDKVCCH
jgi:hypothetical protein